MHEIVRIEVILKQYVDTMNTHIYYFSKLLDLKQIIKTASGNSAILVRLTSFMRLKRLVNQHIRYTFSDTKI